MIEHITFARTDTQHPLTFRKVSDQSVKENHYNADAIANARFLISGSADSFEKPPITDFAMQHLYHMEDFTRFYYKKGSFTERKNFHSYLIGYTYSGQGRLKYAGKEYTLTEGDGFYINCMDYHYYEADSAVWDTVILHLGGPLMPYHHQQYMQYPSVVFHESISGNVQGYLEELLTLYSQPVPNRDWQVSACLDNLLGHLLKLQAAAASLGSSLPENLQYLLKYMDHNFDQSLSLDFLADFAGMSKYYLAREFKKYTGFSPNNYLISLRINRVKSLLKNTTLPAVKIAHEVGIHDINNFNNLFKKKTGMTPIQYRNTLI